jgi:hypothetical protein
MAQSPDLVELLEADHRRLEQLVADSDAGPELVRELSAHLVAESQLLYPAARRHLPDAEVTVDGLVEVDGRLEEVLLDLDKHGGAGPGATELGELFRRHVSEQQWLFPQLRQVVDGAELRRLGDALGPTIMEAPTHPHPHLPAEGRLEVIADAVASGVDHIRDALHREEEET